MMDDDDAVLIVVMSIFTRLNTVASKILGAAGAFLAGA